MIAFTEYDVKLMTWSIQTSMNALVAEAEQENAVVSQESATLLIRGLHKLEEKLTKYYEKEILENANESN